MTTIDTTITTDAPASIFTLTDPMHRTDFRSSGMLVAPRYHGSTLQQASKAAADAAASVTGADARRVKAQVIVFECSEFKHLCLLASTLHNYSRNAGVLYDWNGPQKFLPAALKVEFFSWWKDYVIEHATRKASFMGVYRAHYSNLAFQQAGGNVTDLGTLANTLTLPRPDALDAKLQVTLSPAEVPAGDFRNALFADAYDDIKNHFQTSMDRIREDMMETIVDRTQTVLTRLSKACTVEERDNTGKVTTPRGKLYGSLLEESLRLCDVLKDLNPTGSVALRDIRNTLADTLAGVSIETLRESDTLRSQVKDEVDSLLSKFSF